MSRTIDLNCDMGESFGTWSMGDDTAMLAVVSSASVACGFHAGDPLTMLACCRTAAERGVEIGAHVGYRDLAGFGRRAMEIPPGELYGDVLYQLSALAGIAASVGIAVGYVKPHGALYNRIVTDDVQAAAVADAVRDFGGGLPLLGLTGSSISTAAQERGLRFVSEAFIDRGYRADGSLVPRTQPGAMLGSAAQGGVADVVRRAIAMVTQGTVLTDDGSTIPVTVDSLCVHGDTAGSLAMARAVRGGLEEADIRIEAFV